MLIGNHIAAASAHNDAKNQGLVVKATFAAGLSVFRQRALPSHHHPLFGKGRVIARSTSGCEA